MATNIDLGQWLSRMYSDYTAGQGEKKAAFAKGVGALESYADIFRPGGEYGAGIETMIGRGEKKAVASGMQSLVSAGLSNTTMPMHLQQTYEEEIGMPTRMQAEDVRMERLGGALGSLGQMYASYDPGGATAGDIAHMATGGFGTMMQGRIADIQTQQQMRESRARNQAGLPSQQMFGGDAGSDRGGGTNGGGSDRGAGSDGGYPNPFTGNNGGGDAGKRKHNGSDSGGGANSGPAEMWGLYGAEHLQGGLGTYGQEEGSDYNPGSETIANYGSREAAESAYNTKLAELQKGLAAGGVIIGFTPQGTYDKLIAELKRHHSK